MLYRSELLRFVVEGPFGCFTQPGFRTDRVSYPVCTWTAAAGMAKAVFWHSWADVHAGETARLEVDVQCIKVLNPIQTMRMRVNEVATRPLPHKPYFVEPSQSSILLLRDPKYLIEFNYVTFDTNDRSHSPHKAAEIFTRRLARGQHHRNPCFGRRRYGAFVREPTDEDVPIEETRDLGRMPWGIEWTKDGEQILHTLDMKMVQGIVRASSSFFEMLHAKGDI